MTDLRSSTYRYYLETNSLAHQNIPNRLLLFTGVLSCFRGYATLEPYPCKAPGCLISPSLVLLVDMVFRDRLLSRPSRLVRERSQAWLL